MGPRRGPAWTDGPHPADLTGSRVVLVAADGAASAARTDLMHLNDTHLVLLSTAAQRDDHLLTPTAKPGRASDKLAARLEAAGLVEAVTVGANEPSWRRGTDSEPVGLRLLPAGFEALGLRPDEHEIQELEAPPEPAVPDEGAASPARRRRPHRSVTHRRHDGHARHFHVAAHPPHPREP